MAPPPGTRMRMNFGALTDGCGDIDRFVTAMNAHLLALENRLEGKMSDWDGDTRAAYVTEKAIWNTAAGNLETLLTGISGAVGESRDGMYDTERHCTNLFIH